LNQAVSRINHGRISQFHHYAPPPKNRNHRHYTIAHQGCRKHPLGHAIASMALEDASVTNRLSTQTRRGQQMNTNSRFKIYLVLVLLTGVGLALAVPALTGAQDSTRGDRLSPPPADDIIYVAKSGDGSDGNTWETAYTDLQDALAEALSGDQIWVARGVYIPGVYVTDTFTLTAGVQLYGGFDPAAGADQFNERDWGAYPTVLSGDIGGDDTNTDGVVLTTTHIVGDNSYHVVTADGASVPITGSTLLDGFTITAGQANGTVPDNRGGGFYCNGSGSGAECSPSLRHVTFSGNSAEWRGGAMSNHGSYGDSSPSLRDVTFSGNSAGWGGAMSNDGEDGTSSPTLTNVTFSGNSAYNGGGAMSNDGENGTSSPTLTNVTFSGNSTGWGGGAMYNYAYDGTSSPSLANVTFSGNSAELFGGAMFNDGSISGTSSPSLSNVILWGNTAGEAGSQMFNDYASVTVTTSLVQGGLTGGGVYNDNSTVIDGGGNLDADPEFVRHPDPGPDGDWDGVDDDYGDLRLESDSPAIDTGTNSAISLPTDLDGHPRVVDGDGDGTAIVDMGAYEYNCPAGSILYVDYTASGAGGSWPEAKADLALGLKLLSYCPQVSQVWVATGVYTPGTARSDSFQLVEGVAVYGGFDPAAGADQFGERDWQAYPTVLSGDIGGDDTHTDGVVLTSNHIVGGNSYHVVTADGTSVPITGSTLLDGFTITAGQANGTVPDNRGGGFYCNGSGGGVECSPSLRNVTFSGNSAELIGGALYNLGNNNGTSSPSLANVTFSGNSAGYYGGAMYNHGIEGNSSPSLVNVTFSGNSAGWYGGAIYNGGYWNGNSSPSLANVTFSGNSAGRDGGAMYNIGCCPGTSSPSLNNIILWGNTADINGSQLYNGGAYVTVTTSLVQGGLTGGGVYNSYSSTVIDGGGNLDDDPDFVRHPDPGADGDWDGVDDDYGDLHLGAGSPAVDSGTNSAISLPTDLDGDPRIVDGDLDGTATVDMGAYELQTYALDVTLAGTGSGAVSGDRINCGTDCSETYPQGTIVTLTASTDTSSTFTGWSGACTNSSGDCVVTMTGMKAVTATFTLNQYPLTVSLAGTGSGSVSSTPPGIDCTTSSGGSDCSTDFDHGTMVSLVAVADSGSIFSGWGGACTGSGGCTLTMTETKSVTATFDSLDIYLPLIFR
jgi:predicted outer membrane repeat protein